MRMVDLGSIKRGCWTYKCCTAMSFMLQFEPRLNGTRPKRRVKDSIEREQTYPGNITAGFLTIVETDPQRPLKFEPRCQRRHGFRPVNPNPERRADEGPPGTEARERLNLG